MHQSERTLGSMVSAAFSAHHVEDHDDEQEEEDQEEEDEGPFKLEPDETSCLTEEDYARLSQGGDESDSKEAHRLPKEDVAGGAASAHLFVFTADKAGMSSGRVVDREHVNQVVYDMSKNSAYFRHAQKLDEKNVKRIEALRIKLETMTEAQSRAARVTADHVMVELEKQRTPRRVCVVVDMDCFYVSCELRVRPELRGRPVAVGGMGMICTASYEARKFGVRAAMPGFIAKELCPQLIFVPPDFSKYSAVAQQTRDIFAEYDPNFTAGSLDEAYLDLTAAVQGRLSRAGEAAPGDAMALEEEREAADDSSSSSSVPSSSSWRLAAESVVEEIRNRIKAKTGCTCSAGIGSSFPLAKIAADMRKPDGQYRVEDVRGFLRELPVRKVSGIGKVMEQCLVKGLMINTCGDMLENRAKLFHVFTRQTATWLLARSIGIGGGSSKDAEDEEHGHNRKGISKERTFAALGRPADLMAKCEELCKGLAEDMKSERLAGRTLTLKLKDTQFNVRTRAHTSGRYLSQADDLFAVAGKLLQAELPITCRLMGVRMSNFQPPPVTGKRSLDAYLQQQQQQQHKAGLNDEEDAILKGGGGEGDDKPPPRMESSDECMEKPMDDDSHLATSSKEASRDRQAVATDTGQAFICPVCNRCLGVMSNAAMNTHLDQCLGVAEGGALMKRSHQDGRGKGAGTKKRAASCGTRCLETFFGPVRQDK